MSENKNVISDQAVEAIINARTEDEARAVLEKVQSDAWEAGMLAAKLLAAGIKPARNPYI